MVKRRLACEVVQEKDFPNRMSNDFVDVNVKVGEVRRK